MLADVEAGYVTSAHAAETYGVIVDAAGRLDPEATLRRRAALAQQ